MPRLNMAMGCVAVLIFVAPAQGAVIVLSDLSRNETRYAALGVHVQTDGPVSAPTLFVGEMEVLGAELPSLQRSDNAHFHSGTTTFAHPATTVTLDVNRANNSPWNSNFELAAYHHGKRVNVTVESLEPLGDMTQITVSAPLIDKIRWSGSNWVLQPYVVQDLHVGFAATAQPPASGGGSSGSDGSGGTPIVGQSIPEPAMTALFTLAGAAMLLRRPAQVPSRTESQLLQADKISAPAASCTQRPG